MAGTAYGSALVALVLIGSPRATALDSRERANSNRVDLPDSRRLVDS